MGWKICHCCPWNGNILMKIGVTGGTGFIGSHVVNHLLNDGHELLVTGTNEGEAQKQEWYGSVRFLRLNIHEPEDNLVYRQLADCDEVIHLVWNGLPYYQELFHYEENLMPQYLFLKRLIELGLQELIVTGTCLEYGMKSGALNVQMPAEPTNAYALAKDTLHRFLRILRNTHKFNFRWIRLFYMYGKGQSPKSLLSQLDQALDSGEKSFNMTGGNQMRDYLPVEDVAEQIIAVASNHGTSGVYNCCSGNPVSIRKLVEDHLSTRGKTIILNLGYYPYPDYEPMDFWGEPGSMNYE